MILPPFSIWEPKPTKLGSLSTEMLFFGILEWTISRFSRLAPTMVVFCGFTYVSDSGLGHLLIQKLPFLNFRYNSLKIHGLIHTENRGKHSAHLIERNFRKSTET